METLPGVGGADRRELHRVTRFIGVSISVHKGTG